MSAADWGKVFFGIIGALLFGFGLYRLGIRSWVFAYRKPSHLRWLSGLISLGLLSTLVYFVFGQN